MSTLKAVDLQHPSAAAANISLASSGNVGIGTTTPAASVSITKQTTTLSGTGNAYGLYMYPTSSGLAYIDAVTSTSGNTSLGFRTYNNGTYNDAVRIDSSGNVGIGTSSPGVYTGYTTLAVNNATTGGVYDILSNGTRVASFFSSNVQTTLAAITNIPLSFRTNNTEAMRIDSSGNLLVRTTTAGGLLTIDSVTGGTSSTKVSVFGYGSGLGYGIEFRPNTNTGATPCRFLNAAGTEVGFISTSSSGTTYSTTSDYRLKHTVAPLTIGLATVSALNPVTYKWNVDDSNGEGFIAHELQSVIPHAVTGEKDAVNEDGSIKPQGVDYSKIVVHLVAAVQELKAQNDELKARVATLEAK